MVTDTSLTNILVVNGVSQIRYRAYTDTCKRSTLLHSLKKQDHNSSNALIQAFHELCDLNIPCTWRAVPLSRSNNNNDDKKNGDTVKLELWVFWFDERHTGRIDGNDMLNQLEEVKMGTFTWETVTNGLTTAKSSPSASSSNGNKTASNGSTTRVRGLVSVFEEYKLFIRSIRNVVHKSIIAYGAVPLGDVYIMPECRTTPEYDLLTSENYTASTTAAVAYNAYITGTDLVFRPYTRQLRLRRLTSADGPGTKVILAPAGEHAYVTLSPVEISEHAREKVFLEWSALFNIQLTGSFVAIRTKTNATVLYPSMLVFVPTPIRDSPTLISGMNGVLGKNRGLTEDIGKKWSQWAWSEHFNKHDDIIDGPRKDNDCRINYWNYNKRLFHRLLDALTVPPAIDEHNVIQKMMEQPIILSPLMAAKSVGTPSLSPFALPTIDSNDKSTAMEILNNNSAEDAVVSSNISSNNVDDTNNKGSSDSLQDFIARNFAINMPIEELSGKEPLDPNADQQTQHDNLNTNDISNDPNAPEEHEAAEAEDVSTLPQEIAQTSPTENMDDFGLSYGMDEFSDHRQWDGGLDNDLGDFDFDVTEADFDFFAPSTDSSSKKATVAQTTTDTLGQLANTSTSLLPMEDVIPTTADNPLGISAASKEEPMLVSDDSTAAILSTSMQDVPMVSQQEQHLPAQQELHENANIKVASMPTVNSSPVASDITAVASSDAGASTAVPATFDTSIYTMTPDSRSPTLVLTKAKYVGEHQHLVPHDFAPVSFVAGVDNTKYLEGGKFTYACSDDESDIANNNKTGTTKHRRARINYNMYRPDYIPRKLMKSRRKAARLMTENDQTVPIEIPSSSDSESSSSSSSNDSDEDYVTSSSISLSSQEEEEDIDPVDRLLSAQMTYVRRLLGDIRNRPKRHRLANVALDYDSPFGGIVIDSVHPEKLSQNDIASLDHLCQQTVWGGYPFAGVLPDGMSFCPDGTYHDEAAEAVIARQTELIQSIRGDVTHVPSLSGTTARAIHDFKTILKGIFQPTADEETIPPIGSIGVKGPLKVQEYYELSAENAPVHSKYYGKFQVKKRKSGEPNLNMLLPPDIVVGRQSEWVEGSTAMVGFWEKLRLEPYSSKNNILYFVVYPDNRDVAAQLSTFFTNLNNVYETCQLGLHRPGATEQFYHGAVPVPSPNESTWKDGYMAACENLGSALGRVNITSQEHDISNIVIYLMNPSSQLSSNLDLSRCFSKLLSAYITTARRHRASDISTSRFVMQILPLDHALRLENTCTLLALKDIAFSIYSQCHSIERRQDHIDHVRSISSFYTPPWIIAQQPPGSIKLSIKNPLVAFPTVILDPSATLHMAYSFSLDRRWMVIVWSDHRGELLEFAVLEIQAASSKTPVSPLVKVFTEAWTRTRNIARRTGIAWSFVLAKIGLIFESELQAWLDSLHSTGDSEEKVAIISMDVESPLHFDDEVRSQHNEQDTTNANVSDAYTFASSSPYNSTTNSTPSGTIKPTATPAKELLDVDSGTYMIMLNHRMAYSRQRVNIYQGDLAMEPMNELDSWILSLSTGYLVISRNPALEQGLPRSQPLALELHLVYNNLSRTPYTALHDIIKQYHALSYVNYPPSYASSSNATLLPTHIALVERLCRILLVVGS
ncbi:mediator complex subunit 13 C-terminal-domain-containing protein [Zychaea mexicana]|uniref:mediator complex subunit 13 C-terminal-domain-containing protein n=1 Tax=Zychaea mexicana TaxID=64656 RepID=UPI0022FDDFCC|nr:mediator complex subunit 13 C-terminal-domain-containing protein [Zychaea mexicana]KAI9499248.1 mediator complex subunit 13 C-terminal-domain-containing protein [Zychaea mexicana]